VLLSGRWYQSKSTDGPWAWVSGSHLPKDFAHILPDHPKAAVLVSVRLLRIHTGISWAFRLGWHRGLRIRVRIFFGWVWFWRPGGYWWYHNPGFLGRVGHRGTENGFTTNVNVYNRWGGNAIVPRATPSAESARASARDTYAGRDGNVYERQGNGWRQRSNSAPAKSVQPSGDLLRQRQSRSLANCAKGSLGEAAFNPGRSASRAAPRIALQQVPTAPDTSAAPVYRERRPTRGETTRTASGVTYSVAGRGSGRVDFGTAAPSKLVTGPRNLYLSADENIVLAGSPRGFDLLVGIQSFARAASNATTGAQGCWAVRGHPS
jgi:hypothetical protein